MTAVPMWNRIQNSRLNKFDIKLLDQNSAVIPDESMPDYHMTLMFEVVEEIEYTREDIEDYNRAGYKLGHPTKA